MNSVIDAMTNPTSAGGGTWSPGQATAVTAAAQRDPSAFLNALRGTSANGNAAGDAAEADDEKVAQAREAATQLVAEAFIKPVLAAMHESPWGDAGPFAPGPAERRFTPLLDQHLADRITQRTDMPLIDAIVRQITGSLAPAPGNTEPAEGAIDVQG